MEGPHQLNGLTAIKYKHVQTFVTAYSQLVISLPIIQKSSEILVDRHQFTAL
jgi:hypothetical protein